MYDKRPTRWRDVPRDRDDVFLPLLTPWPEFERSTGIMRDRLPYAPDQLGRGDRAEDLRDHVRGVRASEARCRGAARHQADGGRVPGGPAQPDVRGIRLRARLAGILARRGLDAEAAVPELEALLRWAMVLHNQYPWAGSTTRLAAGDDIGDDDFVVLFYPRDDEVAGFHPAGAGRRRCRAAAPRGAATGATRASRRGLPACRGPQEVRRHAAPGVACGRDRRICLHQRGHHP